MIVTKMVQIQLVSHQQDIRETLDRFLAALNFVSQYAHQYNLFGAINLQKQLYHAVRAQFGLKSQMTINCFRKVAGAYKGNKTKNQPLVEFKFRSMTLNYPRDYRVVGTTTVSLNTIQGRKPVVFQAGSYQQQYLNIEDWVMCSANLIEHPDGRLFFMIAIEKALPDIPLDECNGAVGADLGINFVAVTTDSRNKTCFYGGRRMKYTRWKYAHVRQQLQQKGTRSAKRRLKKISGREKRFIADQNHCIAKKIVQQALKEFTTPLIVLEALTGVRKNPRKTKAGKRQLNNWSYYQLQRFIEYKALEQGIPVVYIDPKYTSQTCPRCGHKDKANRSKKDHWFTCQHCTYQSNDDCVANMNIRNRGVVARYIRAARSVSQSSHDVAGSLVPVTSS
ncbi:MAG: RNA-guided endonuclease InsQ/TnpB family protein [Promethearchaeota archaeon]